MDQLYYIVRACYRKHVMDDQSVGWEELSDALELALFNEHGDASWVKKVEAEKDTGLNIPKVVN